jgi:hypothetical protein
MAPGHESEQPDDMEELDAFPPSPASTVCVPRRHSNISILERPSTIRLVASPPPPEMDDEDQLPLFPMARNTYGVGGRRSMAPLRSPPTASVDVLNTLNRKSMPALVGSASASISSIYPPLPVVPPLPAQYARAHQPIPGDFPMGHAVPASPAPFVFGVDKGVSNADFGSAMLAELQAKMGDKGGMFGSELLKGRKAEVRKLVSVNEDLGNGVGGWGLTAGVGSGPVKKDRFAEAHEREFAR